MNDREKLIELLMHSPCTDDGCCFCDYEDSDHCRADGLADHLIANGVVVREKGEWEIIRDDFDNELMRCPFCREEFYDGENDTVDHTPNFCPHCGADMRKGENDA